jgi:hypothetical protein
VYVRTSSRRNSRSDRLQVQQLPQSRMFDRYHPNFGVVSAPRFSCDIPDNRRADVLEVVLIAQLYHFVAERLDEPGARLLVSYGAVTRDRGPESEQVCEREYGFLGEGGRTVGDDVVVVLFDRRKFLANGALAGLQNQDFGFS